jgi:soluble lytic murein transglycosylase-like protein
LFVLLIVLFPACSARTVWDIEIEEFQTRLRHGNYEFLRHLDYPHLNMDEVTRLGTGGAFYMAAVYDELGMPRESEAMLAAEWRRGTGIWQREAGHRLLRRLLRDERYAEAEAVGEELHRRYPDDRRGYRLLLEAVYWQQKDARTLELLEELRSMGEAASAYERGENLLFQAAVSHRLEREEWVDLFSALIRDHSAQDLHSRALNYLEQHDGSLSHLSEREIALLQAKNHLAWNRHGEAATLFDAVLGDDAPLDLTPALVWDAYAAYVGSGRALVGAGVLAGVAAQGTTAVRRHVLETAGRLYRLAGHYTKAQDHLADALVLATERDDYDRILWYFLSSRFRLSPRHFLESLAVYASTWHEPSYFTDLLTSAARRFVANRDWRSMWQAYQLIAAHAEQRAASYYAFVLSRLAAAGMLTDLGQHQPDVAAELLDVAEAPGGHPYFQAMAAALSDELPELLRLRVAAPTAESGADIAPMDALVRGYFDYSLAETAYREATARAGELSAATIRVVSRNLHDRGAFLESIRLLSTVQDREAVQLTLDDLRVLYPRPYSSEIGELVSRHELPAFIFYALVREESLFDPAIVSRAGAVGLTQLMPETAADVARRLRLESYELTDPVTNLSIGAYHLRYLLDRLSHPAHALMAYNAGYSRVRRWLRRDGAMPDELFLEMVPFDETRNYGRKVLVSAIVYGYLYEELSPLETVRRFFPNIHRSSSNTIHGE